MKCPNCQESASGVCTLHNGTALHRHRYDHHGESTTWLCDEGHGAVYGMPREQWDAYGELCTCNNQLQPHETMDVCRDG